MCVASLESHLAGPFKLNMSNHKLNKLVLTKRPARFLPDEHQIRKDFGGVSKKPKLDVRLSQSAVSNVSNTFVTNDHFGSVQKRNKLDVRLSQSNSSSLSVTNAPAPSTSDAALDDLWGEELSAEAVEECLFLASQVCPEVNIVDNTSSNNQRELQHSYQGKNGNVGGTSTSSSSDGHFKIPVSSVRHSDLKVKQPTSSVLLPSRDTIRTSIPVNQTTNSPSLKKSTSSSSHLYLPNASVIESRNPVVNGVHTVSNESGALVEEIQKLKLENKDLKDKSLSREGEVSILRQQLKQLQMQLESQRIENISKLEEQAQKFKDQLNERKKELEITNTQLQFKIMEATTMRNHCKLLESNSKLKLVEPQRSSTSDSVKAKGDCFSESILPSDISPPKIHSSSSSRIRGQTSTPTKRMLQKVQATDSSFRTQRNCSVPKNDEIKPVQPREGSMLGVAVNEFLFRKSVPEVSWILHIRKKQSLCRRIKEADDINSTILSLQQNDRTLESCYTAVNRLIAMDSLSSPMAWPYIEKVVEDCQEIVCRQVHILRLLLQVQSKTERVLLSEEIASVIGTLAVKKDRRLMSAKPWYRDEEGVESRRALGLLSVLCDVSHLAADLITGTVQPSTKGEIAEKGNITKTAGESLSSYSKRLLLENSSKESYHNNQEAGPSNVEMESSRDADNSVMEIEFASPECSNTQNSTKPFVLQGFGEGYCEYMHRPFGFLRLLRDLASSISIQRRTRHFIGVLTGMMAVLKAVVSKSTLVDDGLKLMSQIIQEVVFACPQVEVIVAVFELLRVLTPYTEIMNTLCHNCESSALVDKRYINLTYFSRGSCVTQVLFRLLPKGETSMSLCTNLCSHMMHWLYNMVCIPSKETSWLLVLQDDATRTCHCKHKLTQGLVITLYNSVCDFERVLTKGSKLEWELRHILVMGVMVLRNLLQREFGLYFECAEEEYQLLISKIQIVSDKLELNSMQRECLTDLLNIEEKNDEEKTEIQEPFNIYWDESASQCRTLLSSRAPSRKQPPKKPRRSIAQINKAWNIAV